MAQKNIRGRRLVGTWPGGDAGAQQVRPGIKLGDDVALENFGSKAQLGRLKGTRKDPQESDRRLRKEPLTQRQMGSPHQTWSSP